MAPSAPDAVPEPATLRGSAVTWLTASDVAEMLYGAVVAAAVLAVVSAHTEAVWRMLVAGIVTLLVYWPVARARAGGSDRTSAVPYDAVRAWRCTACSVSYTHLTLPTILLV